MALFSRIRPASSVKTLRRFCTTSLVAFSAVLGSAGISAEAVAGFQWIAPIEKAPTPVVPPSGPVDGAAMPAPMQLPAVVPEAPPPPAPSIPSTPGIATPVTTPTPAAPPSASEMVDGFGRDIPLTVALKQILPPSYGFALDGVDGGMLVSWEGGKAWYHVLDDMLTKAKLYGREEGQIIKISQAKMHDAAPGIAAKEPPVIVPPMPVLDNKQSVQKIETTPPVAAAKAQGIEPLVIPSAIKADGAPLLAEADSALPPIPQGELVAPNATMMPQLQPTAAEMWRAEPGDHLHAVIKKWCARAHVELVWSTEYDYPIQASLNFSGSFEDAVRGLLTGFVEAKPQPYGRLHDNPSVGQRTLVIETRGNTNSD
ncbi:MAG: TcpQ domain-containing protein [Alphaproteobacteria bacterium]